MVENAILGRSEEKKILKQVYGSKEAELVALYGRRRVGKTYLIRNYFEKKGTYLEATGIKGASLHEQLENFTKALSVPFFNGAQIQTPKTWKEAFAILTQCIQSVGKKQKVVVFLDELPWLSSPRSGLMQALDLYWNAKWSSLSNFVLIVCGSAASWMLEHVVNAKGGLYNRLTKKIALQPFNLKETQDFLKKRSIELSQKQVLDLYMALGGIPYYLKEITNGSSVAQNIDRICFRKNGLLATEFQNIFRSLFEHSDNHMRIIKVIADAGKSISRDVLIDKLDGSSGGRLKNRLEELETSGFIRCFIPFGNRRRNRHYRIIDEYTLFYLKWIEPILYTGIHLEKSGYWQKKLNTPARFIWAGYAFESVCLKHADQIADALDLNNVSYECGSWRYIPSKGSKDRGAQIDLLFDRDDGIITLCEIKYSEKQYAIDKEYSKKLLQKIDVFEEHFSKKKNRKNKSILLVLITSAGLKSNIYSTDLVHNEVGLNDLFQ